MNPSSERITPEPVLSCFDSRLEVLELSLSSADAYPVEKICTTEGRTRLARVSKEALNSPKEMAGLVCGKTEGAVASRSTALKVEEKFGRIYYNPGTGAPETVYCCSSGLLIIVRLISGSFTV